MAEKQFSVFIQPPIGAKTNDQALMCDSQAPFNGGEGGALACHQGDGNSENAALNAVMAAFASQIIQQAQLTKGVEPAWRKVASLACDVARRHGERSLPGWNGRRGLAGFWLRERGGATAVEFALIAGPAVLLLCAIFNVGLFMLMQRSLDHATLVGARAIMTGAVTTAGLSSSQFESQYICSSLPTPLFNCSNLFVQLSVVAQNQSPSGYYAYVNSAKSGLIQPPLNSATDIFLPGLSCQYIVLQVLYPQPYFFSAFKAANSATYNGRSVSVLMSSAAFKSEPYSGAAASAGC